MKKTDVAGSAGTAPAPAEEKEIRVLFRVGKNGTRIAGGTAAEGKELHLRLSKAKFHQEQGDGTIIGS